MAEDPSTPPFAHALDAHRLRWLVREELRQPLLSPAHSQITGRPGAGFVVVWFATFLPVLFTSDLRDELDYVLRAAGHGPRVPSALFALHAASARLHGPKEHARLLAAVDHHSSSVRQAAYRSLALIVDDFRFDNLDLQAHVEHCIREHYIDAEQAAMLLLVARGDPEEKRRWAAAQLVRHAGHARQLTEVLDAAANCRPVPNAMLPEMLQVSIAVSSELAASAGSLPFPGAEGTPDDWAQRDIVSLGQDLWPRLYQDRIATHPLFGGSIDLEERGLESPAG